VIILGIETATAVCGASLVHGDSVLAERRREADKIHSETLMSFIDECLVSTVCSLAKLDGIAVSLGPGSFTGLRIGLSVAKGLAYATEKPLAGIPTLQALAFQAVRNDLVRKNDYILSVIDARRDELYCALYRRKGDSLEQVLTSQSVRLKDLPSLLPRGSTVLMGDGAAKAHNSLANSSHIVVPPEPDRLCNATIVALLGERMIGKGEWSDAASLEPLYVKEFFTTARPLHSVAS